MHTIRPCYHLGTDLKRVCAKSTQRNFHYNQTFLCSARTDKKLEIVLENFTQQLWCSVLGFGLTQLVLNHSFFSVGEVKITVGKPLSHPVLTSSLKASKDQIFNTVCLRIDMKGGVKVMTY